jgi:GTP pyrophosphokinase
MDKDYKEKFLEKIKKHYSADSDGLIECAFFKAEREHEISKHRDSGEEYFVHPVGVAEILVDIGLDAPTIAAALLHDILEETNFKEEQVIAEFGEEVGALVKGVTKMRRMEYQSREEAQAENFRNMFLAMAKDVRVLLIKLADRLYNMRTIKYKKDADRRLGISRETLEIYAPLAGRLGLSYMKSELEDLAFAVLYPDSYKRLAEFISQKLVERKDIVDSICGQLQKTLAEMNIVGEVSGRPKHLYGIYRKMITQNRTFEQVYDLTAVRVIVETVGNCYEVLGKIHTIWKPIPGRFRDYIAVPKPNNYQSLHTTVMTNYGTPFEIQIRTFEMHRIAEYGIASHWRYKDSQAKRTVSSELDNAELNKKVGWLKDVMEVQGDLASSEEFLSAIKTDLYSGQVFVFTPKGKVIVLPEGSTPIDFAYAVHTDVGNRCVGANINSKLVPLATKLQTGDYIQIFTNDSKGPSRDWLKIVKTTGARAKIRAYFKKEMKEENIKVGRDMLEAEAKRKGYTVAQLFKSEYVEKIISKMSFTSMDDLYSGVGSGSVSIGQVLLKLIDFYKKDTQKDELLEKEGDTTVYYKHTGDSVVVKGSSGLKVLLGRCCSPVPGDEITAYISRGRGAVVHRRTCYNVRNMEAERLLEAAWTVQTRGFVATVRITADDESGILQKILGVFSEQKLQIEAVSARIDRQRMAVILISTVVNNSEELSNLFKKIDAMPEVHSVSRSNN